MFEEEERFKRAHLIKLLSRPRITKDLLLTQTSRPTLEATTMQEEAVDKDKMLLRMRDMGQHLNLDPLHMEQRSLEEVEEEEEEDREVREEEEEAHTEAHMEARTNHPMEARTNHRQSLAPLLRGDRKSPAGRETGM